MNVLEWGGTQTDTMMWGKCSVWLGRFVLSWVENLWGRAYVICTTVIHRNILWSLTYSACRCDSV